MRKYIVLLILAVCHYSVSAQQTLQITNVYDELERLTGVYYDTGDYLTFSYDEVGNRIAATKVFAANQVIGEVGCINIGQPSYNYWHTVNLQNTYTNPIVVMGAPTYNGSQPGVVRLKNITSNSFKFQFDEWDYLDGKHYLETFSYLVMEAGEYNLPGGEKVMAGTVQLDHNWKTVNFSSAFNSTPSIVSTCATPHGGQAVTTRHKSVNPNSFQIRLQEEEANDGVHYTETVNWVAIEKGAFDGEKKYEMGATSNSVTNNWYNQAFLQNYNDPIFIGAVTTTDGYDPCALRYKNLNANAVQFFVEEEKSADSEINHYTEVVSYFVFEGPGNIQALSNNLAPLPQTSSNNSTTTDLETITKEQALENVLGWDVEVSPNPTSGLLSISFMELPKLSDFMTINVFNVNSQLIMQKTIANHITSTDIDLSGLSSGNYVIQFISGTESQTKKVVLAR